MKVKKINLLTVAATFLFVAFSSFAFYQQAKPWPVPEAAKKAKNPLKADQENISIGKSLYAKHCRSCHGKNGEGDGPKAAELKTFPGDFTTSDVQTQTDGELFYKTAEGREDMPSFKKKIPDTDDLWALVHYLRTMKAS